MNTVAGLLRKLAKPKGVMISIDIPTGVIGKLPNIEWPEESEREDESHVSVVLFDDEESLDKERLVSLVWSVCTKYEKMIGKLNGVGRFLECHKEGFHCVYLNFDCPGLSELRNELVETLEGEGYKVSKNHGYTPHMTLAYIPKDGNPDLSALKPLEVEVKGISVYWNNDQPVLISFGAPPVFGKLIKVLDSVNFLKWEEQEHPRAEDGRFGTKSGGQQGGKLTGETNTIQTHAKHGQNTQIRDLAREHFKIAAGKVRGAIGPLNREADAQLVQAMDGYRNIMRLGDPREAFNYFVRAVGGIAGVDAKEINRIALNQRNMYYAKLKKIKLEPKPVEVKKPVNLGDADAREVQQFLNNDDLALHLIYIMNIDGPDQREVRDKYNKDLWGRHDDPEGINTSVEGEIDRFVNIAADKMAPAFQEDEDTKEKFKGLLKDKLVEEWQMATKVKGSGVDVVQAFKSKQSQGQAELCSKIGSNGIESKQSLGGGDEGDDDDYEPGGDFDEAYNAWMDAQPDREKYDNTDDFIENYEWWKQNAPIDKIPKGLEDSSGVGGHANLAYRIKIEGDGRACLKGVTYEGEYGMPQNEVFCYQAATLMGFDITPPCVYRQDEKLGNCSAQSWVENGVLGAEIMDDPHIEPIKRSKELLDSISQLAVFDVVLGNRDRHSGNWMFDRDSGKVVGIDNGLVGLDAGRGDMKMESAANIAWSRAQDVSDAIKPGGYIVGLRKIIKPEHIEQARKFVESPEFIGLLKEHFEQQQFQDHLKIRHTTSTTYIKNMVKMTKVGLAKLDKEMAVKKVLVSDLLKRKYDKIRVV